MPANVQELMIRHLPARSYIVLEAAGRLADAMGMPIFAAGGIVRDLLLGVRPSISIWLSKGTVSRSPERSLATPVDR